MRGSMCWRVGLLGLAGVLVSTIGLAEDESAEPSITYTLKINQETVSLTPGQSQEVKGAYVNPRITLDVAPSRRFPYAGLAFSYPAAYGFEADVSDPQSRIWTLDGNNVVIMVFAFAEEVTPESLARSTAESLGFENPEVKPVNITLGGEKLTGSAIRVVFGTEQISQQFIGLPTDAGVSRVLVLQDSPQDSGEPSDEFQSTLELLQSSLTLTSNRSPAEKPAAP